jgi:hypothetical protein
LLELIFLAGCVVSGFGITYLTGIALSFEERVAFGAVLGAMAVAVPSFILSMAVRDVTAATVLISAGVVLVAAGVVVYQHRVSWSRTRRAHDRAGRRRSRRRVIRGRWPRSRSSAPRGRFTSCTRPTSINPMGCGRAT